MSRTTTKQGHSNDKTRSRISPEPRPLTYFTNRRSSWVSKCQRGLGAVRSKRHRGFAARRPLKLLHLRGKLWTSEPATSGPDTVKATRSLHAATLYLVFDTNYHPLALHDKSVIQPLHHHHQQRVADFPREFEARMKNDNPL